MSRIPWLEEPALGWACAAERSHRALVGTALLVRGDDDVGAPTRQLAARLYDAPFALLVHDGSADPRFVFASRRALELFELDWSQLLAMRSRESAEPGLREERARLLAAVERDGFITDYSGVRVSSTGRRFRIARATVWNVVDERGVRVGQAAAFSDVLEP